MVEQDQFMLIANRLKYARTKAQLRQEDVAELLAVKKSSVSRWETGGTRKVKLPILQKLAEIYHVSPLWLLGKDVPMVEKQRPKNLDHIFLIPVVGNVPAGTPILADENITGYLPIDPNILHTHNIDGLFFLKVQGESMNKTIPNGSYILVKQQTTAEDNDIVVAIVNDDNECTVKRFKNTGNPQFVMLQPESTFNEYTTRIIDLKNDQFRILGKVIGSLNINI